MRKNLITSCNAAETPLYKGFQTHEVCFKNLIQTSSKPTVKWLVMMAALLLTACSSDSSDSDIYAPNTSAEANTIRFNADVWRMMETRAATFDSQSALQTEAAFTAAAYTHNTTTAYFSPVRIDWVTDSWEFSDGKHYWPSSGSLDFFAYMPASASLPSYMGAGPTYSVIDTNAQQVSFTCTSLPMTSVGQSTLKEFIYALAADQDKAGTNSTLQPTAGEVALTFTHPFARIKLQLSASQSKEVTINTITFKNIKATGSYTHSAGWSSLDDNTDLVVTLNHTYSITGAVQDLGSYIMIPQDWAGEIEVSASWKVWDEPIEDEELTATVPATWQPGYSYTYSFTISERDLIVDSSKYTEQW